MFLCFADVINIVLVFRTNKAHFRLFSEYLAFWLKLQKNYAIFVICTKNKTICGTWSINMLTWADEACNFTDFSNIMSLWRHNNVLLKI